MVTVILLSETLLECEYVIDPIDFPEAPKNGDYIDVLHFVKSNNREEIKQFLEDKNKISLGKVNGRSWGQNDNKLSLFVHLDFEDLEDEGSTDAASYIPG